MKDFEKIINKPFVPMVGCLANVRLGSKLLFFHPIKMEQIPSLQNKTWRLPTEFEINQAFPFTYKDYWYQGIYSVEPKNLILFNRNSFDRNFYLHDIVILQNTLKNRGYGKEYLIMFCKTLTDRVIDIRKYL